jgi:hypothetical protein
MAHEIGRDSGSAMGRRAALGAIGVGTLGALAGGALGQGSTQRTSRGRNVGKTPGEILTRHPFDRRDWTLTTEVRLHGFRVQMQDFSTAARTTNIRLNAVAAVFPLIHGSAMHEAHTDRAQLEFMIMNRVVNDRPKRVPGYQGPTDLLVVDAQRIDSPRVGVRATLQMTSADTRIDEDLARAVAWPAQGFAWGATEQANLLPQLFVESDSDAVRGITQRWIREGAGGDPRRMSPYNFAKFLAGRVVEHCQPTEQILVSNARGVGVNDPAVAFFAGFNVRGAAAMVVEGQGPPLDLANLLCAVYRAAGIPARLVIAYDARRSIEARSLVVRSWVDFCLRDEANQRSVWIPVDVLAQRRFSSRAPRLEHRWQHFGHGEDYRFACPVAHHWHPPTSVTNAGAPALWGWIPNPANPVADQELSMRAIETVRRGGNR